MNIVDTDIHQTWSDMTEIDKRMPAYFREMNYTLQGIPHRSPIGVLRGDAWGDNGEIPGGSYLKMKEQHLDAFGITHALLTGGYVLAACVHPHTEFAKHTVCAYNDVLIDTWLTWDARFYGSMVVAPQDPQAAAAEIRRIGAHPRIVEVQMASATRIPFGQQYFWPIYEAAEEMGLPIGVHPGYEGAGFTNEFISGHTSTYIEWHTNLLQNYVGQIISLVCEGVFEKFPKLKFVAKEGGFAWLPGVMWRLDKNWKALRSSIPWVKRLPSEYIIDHIRLTTQPIEEPEKPEQLLQILEMIHAEKTLMFASDYPHWDNDSPKHGIPSRIPEDLRARIMHLNAEETYPFHKVR